MIAIVACIIFGFNFGFENITAASFDIALHDSYFVITPIYIISKIFLILSFLNAGLRVGINKFNDVKTNFYFLITTGLLILMISILIKDFSILLSMFSDNKSGWTVYPPTSDVTSHITTSKDRSNGTLTELLIFIQLILLVILIVSSIIAEKKTRKQSVSQVI